MALGPRVASPSLDATAVLGPGYSVVPDRFGFPTDVGCIGRSPRLAPGFLLDFWRTVKTERLAGRSVAWDESGSTALPIAGSGPRAAGFRMDTLRQAQPLSVEPMCVVLARRRRRRLEVAHESREGMRRHRDRAIGVLVIASAWAIGKAGVTAAGLGSGGLLGGLRC